MANTSLASSPPSDKNITTSSLTMTERCTNELDCAEASYSQMSASLRTCVSNIWMSAAQTQGRKRKRTLDDNPLGDPTICACDGTEATAPPRQTIASTGMFAPTVIVPTTSTAPALTSPKRVLIADSVAKPIKHPRPFYWDGKVEGTSHLALISESLPPLPNVPEDELKNSAVSKTISENEHLFSIVMPVNIDRLTSLLINHPNPPFVDSVL